jgi:hypothetical protein
VSDSAWTSLGATRRGHDPQGDSGRGPRDARTREGACGPGSRGWRAARGAVRMSTSGALADATSRRGVVSSASVLTKVTLTKFFSQNLN